MTEEKVDGTNILPLTDRNWAWWFPTTTRKQAEAILSSLGENLFLIRPSTTIENCFVLSKYTTKTKKFLHFVIENRSEDGSKGTVTYRLRDCASDQQVYGSMDELLTQCPEIKYHKAAGTIWYHLNPNEKQMILEKTSRPTSPPRSPTRETDNASLSLSSFPSNNQHSGHQTSQSNLAFHQGYMTKRGKIVKNWKRRWFVLGEGILTYYKTKPSEGHYGSAIKPSGTFSVKGCFCGPAMSLKQAIKAEHFRNCFQIETTSRIYFMYPDSYEEVERWKESLQKNGAMWDLQRYRSSYIGPDGTIFRINETGTEYIPIPAKET